MKRTRKRKAPLAIAAAILLVVMAMVASCKNDSYESGDSRYSYLRADFCMMHTSDEGYIDYLVVDDGDTVRLAEPVALDWTTTKDSLYRALVYYDVSARHVYSATKVLVVTPKEKPATGTPDNDPIWVVSTWQAGGFFNVAFTVKTGQSDEQQSPQQVGLVVDTIIKNGAGEPDDVYLTLTHKQNNQPQYYTVNGYLSTPAAPNTRYHLKTSPR